MKTFDETLHQYNKMIASKPFPRLYMPNFVSPPPLTQDDIDDFFANINPVFVKAMRNGDFPAPNSCSTPRNR